VIPLYLGQELCLNTFEAFEHHRAAKSSTEKTKESQFHDGLVTLENLKIKFPQSNIKTQKNQVVKWMSQIR